MFAVFCLLTATAAACASRAREPGEATLVSLLAADAAWRQAMVCQDPDRLKDLMAADFRLEPADGAQPPADRDTWIRTTVEEMDFGFVDAEFHEIEVGSGRGVVHQRMHLQDWYWLGRPLPANYDLVDTWEWREGSWRVVSRQSTLAED
ncbi:MAG TPA: nuclear transport factor 2 family protein [Planctomycetota bacterium]